jgi:hypothetical protein
MKQKQSSANTSADNTESKHARKQFYSTQQVVDMLDDLSELENDGSDSNDSDCESSATSDSDAENENDNQNNIDGIGVVKTDQLITINGRTYQM